MPENLVGTPMRRREDPRLLTGQTAYTDDLQVAGMAHAAVLRSRFGHARVASIDTAAAEAMDGVVAVYTGADVAASDAPLVIQSPELLPNASNAPYPAVATDRVRYVGEAVAVVVAEDRYTAHDATERIDVEYERLDAVVDPRAAMDGDAPTVHDECPDNVAYDWSFGDDAAVDAAFEAADATASVSLRNQRLIGDPMEPRAVLAEADGDQLTVTLSSQAPYQDADGLADQFDLQRADVRVIAPDVGGGFGIKGGQYPDELIAAWCARALDRPVKWTATRSEGHAADYQSRDWYLDGELALDADGTIRGLRVDCTNTVGAYVVFAPGLAGAFQPLLSGQYAIPAIAGRIVASYTNTTPIAPYRGAGRPEANYLLERLVDAAAREVDLDPAEIRRRNLIPADDFPHETAVEAVYDSGDYERALDVALATVDYEALRERQAALREEGRYLGVGLCSFIENSAAAPGLGEAGRVQLHADGTVTAALGTHDHGQGHGTTYAQLLADQLGVDYDAVEILEGDTAVDIPAHAGTYGSRSAALGGAAMTEAADAVLDRARELAAEHLEVDRSDLEFAAGAFHVTGAPERAMTLEAVAAAADDAGIDLAETAEYDPPNFGWSFGTHVAVVEVDPETGEVAIRRYVAVDDCGTVINPLLVDGQIHGGVAQGIGQALYEGVEYDGAGTLLTGTLQDYALPRAHQLPEIETEETVTPSPHNPLGVKGTGESGTIGSTPAVVNAVVDALAPLGVEDVDMPATPERVWRAIREADGGPSRAG